MPDRRPRRVLVWLCLLLALAGAIALIPSATCLATGPRIAVKLAPDTHLVETETGAVRVVKDWASLASAPASDDALPLQQTGSIGQLGITILEPAGDPPAGGGGSDVAGLLKKLVLTPGVVWAEAGNPIHACLVPDDPWYPPLGTSIGQWGLARSGLLDAWEVTTGSIDVTVAFLDTGINRYIPDFAGRIVSGYSLLAESGDWPAWQDSDGHGSAVTAVSAAKGNDGSGIAGAAWNVGIMPVKISEDGDSDTVILAEAIEYAVDNGADVINISFATPPDVDAGQALTEAVEYAVGKGVTIVAAAGNDGGSVSYPAALEGVIGVGATNQADERWTKEDHGSNTGAGLDVVAPGARILSYYPLSTQLFTDDYSGTSLACPLVAGIAALMLSLDPALTPEDISGILAGTAVDLGDGGWDSEFGWGLVDAGEAVAQAAAGAAPSTTTTTAPATTTTASTSSSTSTTTSLPSTTTTTTTTSGVFADVSEETTPYWFEIGYLAGRNIVSGSTDGLFHPAEGLKRQQFAKIIVLALSLGVSATTTCPFIDVAHTGDLYPYHYVAAAYNAGITAGTTADHFSPYRTLTRAQLITMVARAAGLPEPPAGYAASFPNFSAAHYPYARRAEYAGLLSGLVGMGAGYDFSAPASRGEVCALLYALLE